MNLILLLLSCMWSKSLKLHWTITTTAGGLLYHSWSYSGESCRFNNNDDDDDDDDNGGGGGGGAAAAADGSGNGNDLTRG